MADGRQEREVEDAVRVCPALLQVDSVLFGPLPHFFFFNATATTEIYTLSLHDALPIRVSCIASPRTCTQSPKRSTNCGRSSPSSGFIVPTKTNRAASPAETPSRSTVTQPPAAASNRRSTMWSGSRLTSSTYKTPPSARASRPDRNSELPSCNTREISSDPTTRSSVAPRGSSTNGAAFPSDVLGRSAARPRAAVLLAVPLSPVISTPPIVGSTATSTSASFKSSCPTTAENGKSGLIEGSRQLLRWSPRSQEAPHAISSAFPA